MGARVSPVVPLSILLFFAIVILLIGVTKGVSLQWDIGNFAVGIGTTAVAAVSWASIVFEHRRNDQQEDLKEIMSKKSIVTDFLTEIYALQLPAAYQQLAGAKQEEIKIKLETSINIGRYHAAMMIIFDLDNPKEREIVDRALVISKITDKFPAHEIVEFAKFCRIYFKEEETRIKSTSNQGT